ncbi:Uma2 family endonuclease [Argonema antarcticum]|uniref:Uma2 family endonuclease n=1 Tax=Argonema antarcticum TaxID=2942763 RepID=UPI002011F429|nr:Uma2 family endonuclease [Argonema antarcticum]MCL1472077.1 Uma2 family endonuclease [Argonema antarcticum A004/B2]
MVSTAAKPTTIPPETTLAEQRVVFYNISWQAYEQILAALGESRSSRLTYNEGTLEITMPLEEHESAIRLIELFIRILVVEFGLKVKTMGSTTLNRPDLKKGAEPDNCYYIQNQPKVAGKKVDLNTDPPPDLIAEVDITHTDINKLNLYASMGVPEFWRYNGQILRIYQLQDSEYIEVEHSPTFSLAIKERLYQFLEEAKFDEVLAEKSFRAWVQQQVESQSISKSGAE